jgi:acid phosphatase type 7
MRNGGLWVGRGRIGFAIRRPLLVVTAAVVAVVLIGAGSVFAARVFTSTNPWPYAGSTASPVLATVGDISCQPGSPVENEKPSDVCSSDSTRNAAQTANANQIEAEHPDLVAILGDEQYQVGRYEDFMGSYNNTFGAFKFLERPTPGNHEYYTSHGQTGSNGIGYFDYFNGFQLNSDATPILDTFPITTPGNSGTFTQPRPRPDGQAGEVGQGWYSYNLGDWHIISLNVECENEPGGCDPNGSWFQSETQWLSQDLSANGSKCTIAYWHQPTFSPTEAPTVSVDGQAAAAWWKVLYQHGADIILNGHDHVYARYAPMNPAGSADPKKGIREFIVGTGGESLDKLITTPSTRNVEASTDQFYGTMTLTLNHNSYNWDFESSLKNPTAPAGTPANFSDTGAAKCHGPAS